LQGGRRGGGRKETYVHVHAAREENLAGWVEEEDALNKVERIDDEEIVLPIAAASNEPVESGEQTLRDVPLEALLELEKFSEGRITAKVGESFARRRVGVSGRVCDGWFPWARWGEANLGKEAFYLLQTLSDLCAVVRREVVECER
jgi:hypothetical protein